MSTPEAESTTPETESSTPETESTTPEIESSTPEEVIVKNKTLKKPRAAKRTRKGKKSSACVHLKKDQCRFPCRKVRKTKNMQKYGHCRSMFSRNNHMDLKTKRVVRVKLEKMKKAAKKADRELTKADTMAKKTKSMERTTSSLQKSADKKSGTVSSYFNDITSTITEGLGLSATAPSKKGTKPETASESKLETSADSKPETASESTPEEDVKVEDTIKEGPVNTDETPNDSENDSNTVDNVERKEV